MADLEELLDKKEDFEEAVRGFKYKIKDLTEELEESSTEVKALFKTLDPKKLRVKSKTLDKELMVLLEELEDNEIYQEVME